MPNIPNRMSSSFDQQSDREDDRSEPCRHNRKQNEQMPFTESEREGGEERERDEKLAVLDF